MKRIIDYKWLILNFTPQNFITDTLELVKEFDKSWR